MIRVIISHFWRSRRSMIPTLLLIGCMNDLLLKENGSKQRTSRIGCSRSISFGSSGDYRFDVISLP